MAESKIPKVSPEQKSSVKNSENKKKKTARLYANKGKLGKVVKDVKEPLMGVEKISSKSSEKAKRKKERGQRLRDEIFSDKGTPAEDVEAVKEPSKEEYTEKNIGTKYKGFSSHC